MELKPTELRIGNLLQGKYGYYRVDYLQTNQRDEKQVQAWCVECGKEAYGATEEYLKPIPLTEERILNCGFKNTTSSTVHGSKNFSLPYFNLTMYGDEVRFYFNGFMIIIKYLHQLQNLYFALFGKELEINL
jgi:hypothetical protein